MEQENRSLLTEVEKKILICIALRYKRNRVNLTNRAIALQLKISLHRVRYCIRSINYQLNTQGDTPQAVKVALQEGLIELP